MKTEEDGLESFPLEPAKPGGPNLPAEGDWMNAFPDERLTDYVVIDHKTVPAPPAPLFYVGKGKTPSERALELVRRHVMATSMVALTVMVAPAAILFGARDRDGREVRPVAVTELPVVETSSREATADRHSLGVGGPPVEPAPTIRKAAPSAAASVPAKTTALKPRSAAAAPRNTAPAVTESTAPPPMPPPMAAPTPIPMAVPTPTLTPGPTLQISTPVATPTSSNVPAAPPAPTRGEIETAAIKLVLNRYRQAFDTLSVAPVEAYWPSINAKGLTRAFAQLDSQTVTFDSCEFDIDRDQAAATCIGRTKFTTKVGSRTPHVESRRWAFRLVRMSDRWVILSVDSR